jgi:hypothetical protein
MLWSWSNMSRVVVAEKRNESICASIIKSGKQHGIVRRRSHYHLPVEVLRVFGLYGATAFQNLSQEILRLLQLSSL